MSLNEDERDTLVNLYLERAKKTLDEADVAIAAQKWSMAANRIYYACFHAVTALFVKDGRPVSSHKGAKAVLGQHYVVTGVVSQENGKLFSQLETLRDKADYNIMFEATEADIIPKISRAKAFLKDIEHLVL